MAGVVIAVDDLRCFPNREILQDRPAYKLTNDRVIWD